MSGVMVGALVLGASLGGGLLLIVFGASSRRSLANRLAPWLADVSPEAAEVVRGQARSRLRVGQATGGCGRTGSFGRAVPALSGAVAKLWTPSASVVTVARQAGVVIHVAQWRILVVESALWGSVAGAAFGAVAALAGTTTWFAAIALVIVGACAGAWLRRWFLQRAAKKRVALMQSELPVIADMLALSLTAGESFVDALARVCAHGTGPLADELRLVLRRVELGEPLTSTLASFTAALSVPELTRTFDHIIAGLERGTPLALVLRTQAAEARAEAGRRMQERAATREVAMLVPLIFLILPVTIAFAIFPGLLVIQAGF